MTGAVIKELKLFVKNTKRILKQSTTETWNSLKIINKPMLSSKMFFNNARIIIIQNAKQNCDNIDDKCDNTK